MACAIAAAPAHAAPSRGWLDARAALSRCLQTEAAEARGACLERAARAMDEAEAKGEGPIASPAQRRKVEAQQYGLRVAPPEPTPLPDEDAKPRRTRVRGLSTTVAEASQDGAGNWIMTTAEGAVWAQTDGSYLSRPPHPGSSLQIHPAAMGSYFCLINDRREVRCKRRR